MKLNGLHLTKLVDGRASIGRAGLVAVGTLLFLGVAEELAWQRASLARGREEPDTDEQRLWVSKAFR
jgi:hypothetical protein